MREGCKRLRHLRQDTLDALRAVSAGERAPLCCRRRSPHFALKIVHLRKALDAWKSRLPATTNVSRSLRLARARVRALPLQACDDLNAAIQSVAQMLERTRVSRACQTLRIIETRAHGDLEMIVAPGEERRPNAGLNVTVRATGSMDSMSRE